MKVESLVGINFTVLTVWDLDIEEVKVQGSFLLKQDQEVLGRRVGGYAGVL